MPKWNRATRLKWSMKATLMAAPADAPRMGMLCAMTFSATATLNRFATFTIRLTTAGAVPFSIISASSAAVAVLKTLAAGCRADCRPSRAVR